VGERHDLLVISDEINDRLVFPLHQHVCFAALPGKWVRTITLSGFSEDYARTGWRIGFAAGPAPILAELPKVHQCTIMSAPTMERAAALEAPAPRRGSRGSDGGRVLRTQCEFPSEALIPAGGKIIAALKATGFFVLHGFNPTTR
jgi:aspartate/methionine/tyrosine aminotransferase